MWHVENICDLQDPKYKKFIIHFNYLDGDTLCSAQGFLQLGASICMMAYPNAIKRHDAGGFTLSFSSTSALNDYFNSINRCLDTQSGSVIQLL